MTHTIDTARQRNPMWIFEHNYAAMVSLVPDVCRGSDEIVLRSVRQDELRLRVLERTAYTLTVELIHRTERASALIPDLVMGVRMYQDARLAEVLAYQRHRRFHPVYPYPNEHMYHPDEKRQANQLLSDLLRHFIACGYRYSDEFDVTSI